MVKLPSLGSRSLPLPAPGIQASKDDSGSSQTTASTRRPRAAALLATLLLVLLLYPLSHAPSSALRLIEAGPQTAASPSRSSQGTRKIRVAVYDSFWEHYEVIGPLVYGLSQRSDIELSVYRTHFGDGYPALLAPFYDTPFRAEQEFFSPAPAKGGNASGSDIVTALDADVLFLPSGDRDLHLFIDGDGLNRSPLSAQARIVVGVHQTDQWAVAESSSAGRREWISTPSGRASIDKASRAGRLSFFTLSGHVSESLARVLGAPKWSTGRSVFDAGPAALRPTIEILVPVIPDITGSSRNGVRACGVQHAAIQGTFNGVRDYARVFADLERAIRDDPHSWGYELVQEKGDASRLSLPDALKARQEILVPLEKRKRVGGEIGEDDGAQSPPPFKLHLLGHLARHERLDIGPTLLRNMVVVHRNLQYPEYYATLAEMDLILPAWAKEPGSDHSPYTVSRGSSSVPAGVMARVPVLLSTRERNAYGYLAGEAGVASPAWLERAEGETEVAAIRRLRTMASPCPGLSQRIAKWEVFEKGLQSQNTAALDRLLHGAD